MPCDTLRNGNETSCVPTQQKFPGCADHNLKYQRAPPVGVRLLTPPKRGGAGGQ